jgi:hypothetical protein
VIASLVSSGALASSVHAVFASECGYAIFTGAAHGTELNLIAVEPAGVSPGVVRPPRSYSFEMEDNRYVYVAVCGQDCAGCGLLAEFIFNGLPVLSGDPAWQVVAASCDIGTDAFRLTTADVSQEIRRANRRFAWRTAGVVARNGIGPCGRVDDISSDAAWMWLPAERPALTLDTAESRPADGCCVLFRISPGEIWPEIELWHGQNVGTGPLSGSASDRGWYGGLGGGGGGIGESSGGPSGTGSPLVWSIPNPFPDYEPPNSSSIPPDITPPEPSEPVVPHSPDEPTPPDDSDHPRPPPGPPIPEPTTGLLALLGAARLRGRQ